MNKAGGKTWGQINFAKCNRKASSNNFKNQQIRAIQNETNCGGGNTLLKK